MRAEQGTSALGIVQADLAAICRTLVNVMAEARGQALIEDLRTTVGGTPNEIVWQALYADCLRVVHSAVMADGVIEEREIAALFDIIAAAARHYAAGLRSQYGEFEVVDRESARAFLDRYAADRGPFGRGARVRWLGLTLCRRAAELGEREALQRYTKAMTSMSAEARRLAGAPAGDTRRRSFTDELDELQRLLASEASALAQGVDRRVQAFLAPSAVFAAIQQASSIYESDPFDVEDVHRDARDSFERLVQQAATRPYAPDQGRMLVVLGDSGAGKTHLLRGFRRHVHDGHRGFVVYAQLQSRSEDYSRYLLFHLVASMTRRYSDQSDVTGLRELAGGLLRLARPPLRKRIEALADDSWEGPGKLCEYVDELVTELLEIRELGSFDLDLLRVLLYALRPDQRTTSSVHKYLRCDPMNDNDRGFIGNVIARTRDDDPHWMILGLARFAAVTQRALVIMVDQVDLAGFDASSTIIFRRAIDSLYRIVSECSSAVAVIACLSDLYEKARLELNRPAIDRLEKSPPIARLQINRSYAEIEAVVARRLAFLFAEHGTVHRPEQPVYPIPEDELRQQENRRLRDVLEWCHQFQMQCAAAGKIITGDEPVIVETKTREVDLDEIATVWSEATQAADLEMPDDPDEILGVVANAAEAYAQEMGLMLAASPVKKNLLRLRMSRGEDCAALAISVTDHSYRGGAFINQVDALRRRARGMVPIAVRTLEFPRGPASDKAMGQLIGMRGRGASLDATTLRTLVAFQRFQPPFPADRVSAWKLRDRPIASLPAVIELFAFERSLIERPATGDQDVSAQGAEADDGTGTWPAAPPPEPTPDRDASWSGSMRGTGTFRTTRASTLQEPPRISHAPESPRRPTAQEAPRQSAAPELPRRPTAPEAPRESAAIELPRKATTPEAPRESATVAPPRKQTEVEALHDPAATAPSRRSPSPAPARGPAPPEPTGPIGSAAPPKTGVAEASGTIRGAATTQTGPDSRAGADDPATRRESNGARAAGATEPATTWRGVSMELPQVPAPPKPPSQRGPVQPAARPPAASPKHLRVGNTTGFTPEPVLLEPSALLRHIGVVDGVGNGRIAAVLNVVEQALERCVPAIILDRTGEMSGYARADWWERSADPARARQLAERIDVRPFTPGIRGGRPLSIAVIPDLSRVPEADRERAIGFAVGAVATALPASGDAESERLALLHRGIGALAKQSSQCGLVELIELIEGGSDEAGDVRCDPRVRQRLSEELAALLGNADVFTPRAEPLTAGTLIGPRAGGRIPLAIINTSFLGEGPRLLAWIAQLIGCLVREVAAGTSSTLQTVLGLDGAEMLLPTTAANASAKAPLQELLERAGAAGLGIVLASDRPAELDYQRCTAVDTWFVGKTDESTHNKMKALFKHRPLGHRNVIRLESARFVMLQEDGSREVERCTPLLRSERIEAVELRALAARTRSQAASPPGRTEGTNEAQDPREGVRSAIDVPAAVPRS